MRRDKESNILKSYLKERILVIAFYFIVMTVFMIIAALYGYDNIVKNMRYAVVLCAGIGICAGIADFIRYRKKYRKLLVLLSKQGDKASYMPESNYALEQLYQEIVDIEEEEKKALIFELDEKKQDMADYYTMWTHQIKTPIAAMKLLLQREEGGINKQALEELFKIEQYAEMALHYARLNSISSDMLFKTYDVCDIVKQAVKKYSLLFIGSGLSFTLEEFSIKAVTDGKWLLFIMEQILSNALKYTSDGSIHIYGVCEEDCISGAKKAYVTIEDTGIGIAESDLPRIFERGFTGYNGRLDKKSTGIGLYLCRQILDRLSHAIQVESVQGKGTRVIIGFHQEVWKTD